MASGAPIKHDWYQTDTAVVVTILVKNLKDSDVTAIFKEDVLDATITLNEEKHPLKFSLSHKIVPEQCTYKITPSKVEIKLQKRDGARWEKLDGIAAETETIKVIPGSTASDTASAPPAKEGPPSYPTSAKGKDWNAFEKDIKKAEANEKPEGDEALQKLFQDLYGKGTDEVKKAMNKSYMESGGTVLSTNWDEIGRGKVDVKPPDGMEWKQWE